MNTNFKHYPNRQYPWQWYYSPQGQEYYEVYNWLWQNFGPIGERWDHHGGWIKLRGEEDVILFTLRWS